MDRSALFVRVICTAFAITLFGCSGSGGPAGELGPGGNFVAIQTTPVNNGRIFLNDPVRIDFSRPVDLDSANLNTIAFQVFDPLGNPSQELVSGHFSLARTPGDDDSGRQLVFTPRFPTNNTFDNGGFRGGRTYLVQLVGGDRINGTSLRDTTGKTLEAPISFRFSTVEGTSPAQLFNNPLPGGPRRTPLNGLLISNSTDLENVPLNLFGAPPTEVRITFDQALNPHDVNLPVNFDPDPQTRDISERGRIYLEYDDPEYGVDTWIPAEVELERNDLIGATVALRPVGVLPNNAVIRVIVAADLEDISGESNVGNLGYNPVFGSFRTSADFDQQWNGIANTFTDDQAVDYDAVFAEPQADVGPGYIKAGFAFEGNQTELEFEPNVLEVVLNTSFTQVVPKSGLPFNVSGGVFHFKNVRIPQGVQVKGQGPNPMVWLCRGDFVVAGQLSVDGGRGARVDTLRAANFAKAGGIGVCAGGNGGDGTPSGTSRDMRGGTGNGPGQVPGLGGAGGRLACLATCYTGNGYNGNGGGSGGGGGAFATQGDPTYDTATYTGTQFLQKTGAGGVGCSGGYGRAGTLPGGEAGRRVFADARADNDFWGSGISLRSGRRIRIVGELSVPVGGGGGGGGGDTSVLTPGTPCSPTDSNFANDYSGGGGGGGGGVLIVKAIGKIEITSTGKISADGGHGGGGEQAGSCGEAGGGGAGSGGLVVLMSATKIVIHPHHTNGRYTFRGDTAHPNNDATNKNYDFAISADGAVCTTGGFSQPNVAGKYPGNGQNVRPGSQYDSKPLGAFGGMGVVQLMTPPGDNSDGTNTFLDDRIEVVLPASPPAGIDKRTILGWRGIPDETGTYYDDFNNVIPSTFGEGDIRPAPILLPVPFNSKSRARSRWIDTGRSQRRLVATAGGARAIVDNGSNAAGPIYEFAGLDQAGSEPGYVGYEPIGQNAVRIPYPTPVAATAVTAIDAAATHLGAPAYRLTLASPTLGERPDRYAQYEAELLDGGGVLIGSHRILAHGDAELVLATDGDLLPSGIQQVRVRAKFFQLTTNGSEGLGNTWSFDGSPVPEANVRIGFAFHQDPGATTGRFPADPESFVYDMADADLQTWIQANGQPAFVQWDVMFDMTYDPHGTGARSLSPASPRPRLEYLRIPFRF